MDTQHSNTKPKTDRVSPTTRVAATRLNLRECKTPKKRRTRLTATGRLSSEVLARPDVDPAIEALAGNVIDTYGIPIGGVENFKINGRETLIFMATQERTVVEAASYGARLCHRTNGFRVNVGENIVSCQVAFMPLGDDSKTDLALDALHKGKRRLLAQLSEYDTMRKYGGGIVRSEGALEIETLGPERMIELTLTINAAEAMGANAVTKLGEKLAVLAAPLIGSKSLMSIVTNCFHGVSISANALWPVKDIGGMAIGNRIMLAQRYANLKDQRAATHNKGVSNGVDAVALLCGQDVQAISAAMHGCASARGTTKSPIAPLTTYSVTAGSVRGELRMRIPLGTVGGATQHPQAVMYRKAMGITNVRELGAVLGAVGLAQNFAALRCLVTEGIPEAHARLRP